MKRIASNRRLARPRTALVIGILAILSLLIIPISFIPTVKAPTNVFIGNGVQQINGTYLNAQKIADNLVFTSITVLSVGQIRIVDNIDLSTSLFGIPHFNLSLIAPTVEIDNNMNLGAAGNLFLTTNTLNLTGRITSGGALVDPSRIFGNATQVNVLSNAASIQQGIDFSSRIAPVTVQVSAGQYHENLVINKSLVLKGNDGTAGAGADPAAPEIFGTQAGGNIITVNTNNITLDGLHLNALIGDGTVADSLNGIYAGGVNNLTISHNTLEGLSGSGISTPGSTNVTMFANLVPSITTLGGISMIQGGSGSNTITAAMLGGSSRPVTLSCSTGLPTGVSCAFNPGSGTSSFTSRLTMNTTSSTPTGLYTINVTSSYGSVIHTTQFVLNVCVLLPGDASGDCQVDIVDLAMVGAAFGSTPSSPNWNPKADINQDGIIDIIDLSTVGAHFGQRVP